MTDIDRMIMDIHHNMSPDGENGDDPQIVLLRKELKRALQNDKLKTDLLNKLTKTVKAKDERLAELEKKVVSNDDEKRQEVESSAEVERLNRKVVDLVGEVVTLQDQLRRNDDQWKVKAETMSAEVKALEEKLQMETQIKEKLEAKVASHDEENRHETVSTMEVEKLSGQVEELAGEIQTLQDQLRRNEDLAKATTEQWKEKAEAMVEEVKTLEEKLQSESQAKVEAEQWKGKFEVLSAEAKVLEEKLGKESEKRLELVEQMSMQEQAHKENLAIHQDVYTKGMQDFEFRADALSNEAATLKAANLALQAAVDKSQEEVIDLQASYAAMKSLDQDQKQQIQKLQEEVSSLQAAKAELRRQWVSAANKNQSFQKLVKEEKTRTISELSYWKDMNERLYESFTNNEKLLQEAREESENLKSMEQASKLQVQTMTVELAAHKAENERQRFELDDQIQSLIRRNSHLIEEQTKLTITKEEFREQAEQATERIQQLECKVDTLTAQGKSFRGVEMKRKELQDDLNELQARYDHLSNHYKECLDSMKEERLQFKQNFDNLMQDYKEVSKNFVKARNLINNNAALFVASEMRRQAQVLLYETAKISDKSTPPVPPELVVETPASMAEIVAEEEKKLDDLVTLPLSVEGVDSMLSFESTKIGSQGDDEESGFSSQESDDETADDLRSMNKAELWFWGLLEGNPSKSVEEDRKDVTPASSGKTKREKGQRKNSKNELKFL